MEVRILIVEDNKNWKNALKALYKRAVRECNPDAKWRFEYARDVDEALEKIGEQRNRYHLISTDIDLGDTLREEDRKGSETDGRTIVELAVELDACLRLIVITGISDRDELTFVQSDGHELRRVKSTIHAFLSHAFQGRGVPFLKLGASEIPDEDERIKASIKIIEQDPVFRETIAAIARRTHALERINRSSWRVTFNGKSHILPHFKGIGRIAELLRRPGEDVDCRTLEQLEHKSAGLSIEQTRVADTMVARGQLSETSNPGSNRDRISTKTELKRVIKQMEQIYHRLYEAYRNDISGQGSSDPAEQSDNLLKQRDAVITRLGNSVKQKSMRPIRELHTKMEAVMRNGDLEQYEHCVAQARQLLNGYKGSFLAVDTEEIDRLYGKIKRSINEFYAYLSSKPELMALHDYLEPCIKTGNAMRFAPPDDVEWEVWM